MFESIEDIPAYCISLERRPDRWKRFIGQTAAAGLHVKRWSAVDGRAIDVERDERISVFARRNIIEHTRRSHEEIDSVGAVGCALSHIGLWRELIQSKHEYFLIFEDDARIDPDFVSRANTLLSQSPRLQESGAWDIWMLGGAWKGEEADIELYKKTSTQEPTIRIGKFYLIHGYIINRRAAATFLAACMPIQAHIDHFMSMCARFYGLNVIGSPQLKLRQSGQASDIQSRPRCEICDVPSNVEKYFLFNRNNFAVAAGLLGTILIAGVIFKPSFSS